ncbi:DUF6379 domain-containing protein [Priestia aryabhattai]|uniref:C-glycoside deglycosidase beta subunit domain-containing protein n=1 Tax=Priestia TaxID=2800373 RepID=UPI0028812401|nr:DUF6379 domain-containing protein [Priestia aryabhattai]MDT0145591.1 DUF6379 domain-containing protein [Priestia aryabhattai]MDT0151253.1 DUF6379 domain-containing protein [Priestia aryabhattai]
MFEQYMICEDGFKNVEENNEIIGFEIQLRIPYYRGIALSLINSIDLSVDDIAISHSDLIFKVETGEFLYSELPTVINNRWEFGEKARLFVNKKGGLTEGKHKVNVNMSLRISYLPWPNVGEDTKELVIAG